MKYEIRGPDKLSVILSHIPSASDCCSVHTAPCVLLQKTLHEGVAPGSRLMPHLAAAADSCVGTEAPLHMAVCAHTSACWFMSKKHETDCSGLLLSPEEKAFRSHEPHFPVASEPHTNKSHYSEKTQTCLVCSGLKAYTLFSLLSQNIIDFCKWVTFSKVSVGRRLYRLPPDYLPRAGFE